MRYCSQSCQSKHWKGDHKNVCRKKEFSSVNGLTSGPGVPKVLFPYDEFVRLYNWSKLVFPPCGLSNCGNSCFANVVLQCLACTRPLVAYLLEGSHSRECRRNSWCVLCELQCHIQRVTQNVQPFSPMNILSRLPNISSNLGYGRQEDAHEFMRFVIDTMQSVCLDEHGGEKALAPITQETTLIQQIFGGHLQSQVICTNCNMTSNRYENMMDLTVEIQGNAESLEDCLDQFTVKEWLDGDNMYKCDGCNDYVKAWKRLTVHQAPNILTIALKRFQSGRFGKLNKRVTFPETLDLGPYMSYAGNDSDTYKLFAVVVHLDMLNASFFGHYICYTKDFSGNWYMIDDCKVIKVELEEVLSQGAYMLLYSRLNVRQHKPLEAMKENVPLQKPLEATISGISNSYCSNVTANGDDSRIKHNADPSIIGGDDMNAEGFACTELNKENVNNEISTSMDKCSSSKADTMEMDTDSSLRKCEDGSSDIANGSSGVQTVQEILIEQYQGSFIDAEKNPSCKVGTLETNASINLCEGPSLEQNASIETSGVKVKKPFGTGETTYEMTQVGPASSSFLSETTPESEGNHSGTNLGQEKREGFPESSYKGSETAEAASCRQKTKMPAAATVLSNPNPTPKNNKKLLFARGFLDKPSKKKVISHVRDKTIELSVSHASSREVTETAHVASCGEPNLHIFSDVAKDHAETMNLKREENGHLENGTVPPVMDGRLNGYREPHPVCGILPQNPELGNGKACSVPSDYPACLNNLSREANGTALQVHGDDSLEETMDYIVETPVSNSKESPHPVSELEHSSRRSEESNNDLQYVSDALLNKTSELHHKMSPDGKCNTVEDEISGKASRNCYHASGIFL